MKVYYNVERHFEKAYAKPVHDFSYMSRLKRSSKPKRTAALRQGFTRSAFLNYRDKLCNFKTQVIRHIFENPDTHLHEDTLHSELLNTY